MSPLLQKTVWSALSSRQSHLSLGNDLARRFDPEISPFAASKDNSPEALAALSDLIAPDGDRVYLMQAAEISLPQTLEAELSATGVLMTQDQPVMPAANDLDILPLGPSDHAEMLTLADLTKPGPFTIRTPELGPFWGIKIDGRLAAMAGTRLDFDGFTEVSGVCTHPDFRGRGLASHLSLHAADQIRLRGDTPILHAFADNTAAIALYERLGFRLWKHINVAVVKRAD